MLVDKSFLYSIYCIQFVNVCLAKRSNSAAFQFTSLLLLNIFRRCYMFCGSSIITGLLDIFITHFRVELKLKTGVMGAYPGFLNVKKKT